MSSLIAETVSIRKSIMENSEGRNPVEYVHATTPKISAACGRPGLLVLPVAFN